MPSSIHFNIFHFAVVCLLCAISGVTVSYGQADSNQVSGKIFALQDFERIVLSNHPIVKQAGLLSEQARAQLQQAWGAFDPNIKSHFGRKTFGDTEYYNNWSNELKVPLWIAGADLKIGYDRFVGEYTNPETRTGTPGLTGIGLSIPIGQGLVIDARRNVLRQARVMVNYAEAEKIKQINQVWLSAMKDYWSWYNAHRQYELIREGADLAFQRFLAVKNQALLGDKPTIDSVEVAITFQERSIQFQKAKVALNNSRLLLSNHIWDQSEQPLELSDSLYPENTRPVDSDFYKSKLQSLMGTAQASHPELLMLKNKDLQLQLERNYRLEMLKPKLSVTAFLITSRTDFSSFVPDYYDLGWSNYKLGVDFAFPLFLREQRGKLNEVKAKQLAIRYDAAQTGREINTNILNAFNELVAYVSQIQVQTTSIENQQVLLTGELAKFDLGESTLFLINSRETKLIDMKIKLAEMITGYQKTIAQLYYAAGSVTER
ncbi:transporter [Dyadobacter luteus]|uniref:Transporter n=1 Tax=Dyadobacter luteus TaxID=2259619 RepID=A0A3D8YJW0_9BACT|nr:TolC family protein [Dyadobacter luteus]REA64501.1 transporter [Dyadobacter luteus]